MEGENTKRVFIWIVICALVIQIVPVNITGDTWVQTTQEDFEGGETWNTNVTLSPGNVTLEPSPTDWIKGQGNPVLDLGPAGSYDDLEVRSPYIFNDNGTFKLWYTGRKSGQPYTACYATSNDGFTWNKHTQNPVLVGNTTNWENPSVGFATIVKSNGIYEMWYSGGPTLGPWQIGYANSTDGLTWVKYASNPIIPSGEGPFVLKENGLYKMWYTLPGAGGLNYATSPNGISWIDHPGNPILDVGAVSILNMSGVYYMWFAPAGGGDIGLATSPDGIIWTKYTGNPIITTGSAGSWDDDFLIEPMVIYDGSYFRMWYSGFDGSNSRIGHAISYDGINWTKRAENPVLDIGKPGDWDDSGAAVPSVLKIGDTYKMWYHGIQGGISRIGYAVSKDGISWTKNASNPVLNIGAPGSWDDALVGRPNVVFDDSEPVNKYKMWYTGGQSVSTFRIGYANSSDGINWNKYSGNPVLGVGSPGLWDNWGILSPFVIQEEGIYKMWYVGFEGDWSSYPGRIGYAESTDGLNWVKYSSNPVLNVDPAGSWEDSGVGNPIVTHDNDLYEIWYSGDGGLNQRIGYATSLDGFNWTKHLNNPIIDVGKTGSIDDYRINPGTVMREEHTIKMWYYMNDDTNNRIGYATAAYSQRFVKESSNPVIDIGSIGSWDDYGIGAPSVLYENGTYKMWYTGTEGGPYTDKIGYATSSDGFIWDKYNQNPVLTPSPPETWDDTIVGSPYVIFNGDEYLMYYSALTSPLDPNQWRIGVANSSDGINWIKYPLNPVIDLGPSSWDGGSISSCSVVYNNGLYRMWYTGSPTGGIEDAEIGYATSVDGYNWTKYPSNPVFHKGGVGIWDSSLVTHPSVWYDGSVYHLWYTGVDNGGNFRIGYATSNDCIIWTKYLNNPIITSGSSGNWDSSSISRPFVLKMNNKYRMWYTGHDGSNSRIGHAISYDGINWTKRAVNPIMDVGGSGEWDEYHVNSPAILFNGTTYQMWYGGYDGTNYRIGYATSSDGVNWIKNESNPVIDLGSPGSWEDFHLYNPAVIFDGSIYRMWYMGHDSWNGRIGYATSTDGVVWIKYSGNPVLDLGPSGSWDDEGVHSSSTIFYEEGIYKMWYGGYDGTNRRIGYATSSDGINWTKYPGNPVLNLGSPGSWDETNVYHPNVIFDDGIYKLWYTGSDGVNWANGFAVSLDGINWTKSKINPVLDPGYAGTWDDYRIYYPFIIKNDSEYNMLYNGNDENHVRIGLAKSSYTSTGTYESSIFDSGCPGTFWNYISWNETLPTNTLITLSIRTGDTPIPNSTWTNWTGEIYNSVGSIISQPRSRYIQYRATLISLDARYNPILEDVTINYDLNAASPPTLVSPLNGNWTTNNILTFNWTYYDPNGDMQSGFEVQIDDNSMFGSVDYSNVTTSSSLEYWDSFIPIPDGRWYWRVRTMDEYGLWSDWSENWTINIDTTPPPTPVGVTPDPDIWTNINSFTVNWTNPIDFSGVELGTWYKIGSPPTSNSDGIWQSAKPITVTSFEGHQTIYLWLEDILGNVDYKNNASTDLYLDTTPPSVPVNLGAVPVSWTGSNSFSINWTDPVDDSGVKVGAWYKIGSPPISNSDGIWTDTKPFSVTSSEGQQPIYVWLEDNVGNVDYLNNASTDLYLDTTPPSAPINLGAIPDSWTRLNSFSINWTDPVDDSGVKVGAWYKIGSPPTSNSDGLWNDTRPFTVTSWEGQQPIYVWLEDNIGNVDYKNNATVFLYLDTTPPNAFTPTADPSGWTSNDQPIISFSTTDSASGMNHYEVSIDGEDYKNQNSPYTIPSQTDGIHTVTVRAYDNVGNHRESSVEVYIDTTPPEAFTPTADPSGWTSNNQPIITFSTTDSTSGISHYEVKIDSGSFTLQTSPHTLLPITDGTHIITIRAYDNAENYRDATVEIYIDTTPPLAPSEIGATPDSWTKTNSFIINWTNPIETDTSGIKTGCWYKIGSPPTSNSDGTWVGEKPITVSSLEGEQPIYIWLEDNIGNVDYNNYGIVILYLDTQPPGPPINVTASPSSWTIVNSFNVDWVNPSDDSGVKAGAWYKIGSPPTSDADGTWLGQKPITVTTTEGETVIYIWLEDNLENRNYQNYGSTNLHLDSIAPNITHTPVTHAKKGEAITISATVTDNVIVKTVTLHYKKQGDENFENITMSKDGDVYSADIPSSFVTKHKIEYYISASDEINTATYPSSSATTDYLPIEVEEEDVLFIPSWFWLLLLFFIIIALIVLFFSLRRREEEGGIEAIAEEESELEETGETMEEEPTEPESEEFPQAEPPEETQLPEEESEILKDGEAGAEIHPKTDTIPSLTPIELSDDEIYQKISQMHEEGKISDETFEDFKKRYMKE